MIDLDAIEAALKASETSTGAAVTLVYNAQTWLADLIGEVRRLGLRVREIDNAFAVQELRATCAEVEVARLRAALEKYGGHLLTCDRVERTNLGPVVPDCTCGWWAAMETP